MRAQVTTREQEIVDKSVNIYRQAAALRPNFAMQWEEAAQLVAVDFRNTFFPENYNYPGIKKTDRQVDASGMVANLKFAAICDSMITPFSSKWHNLEASNPYLQKNRQVRLWFEQASQILFQMRYRATANFRKQNQGIYQMIGAFGNGPMYVDQLIDPWGRPAKGFRYSARPVGEIFIRTNHQNQVDTFVRYYRMTARQACLEWTDDMLPEELDAAEDKDSEQLFEFLHCVYPNELYEPGEKLGPGAKPWVSRQISLTGRRLMWDPRRETMESAGFYSFPLAYARYTQGPNEVHGRGPAQYVLPALKTLNAQKATALTVGHRNANPVFLVSDDGLTDFKYVPGAMNKGGVTSDGKPLVHQMLPGDYKVAIEQMEEERKLIGDMFLTTIFQTLVENPQMTATQVIELINQKGIFLAPTVGGMASDYLEPMIERELDLAQQMKVLPPMPPLLKEARGDYKIVYTSPLFKAASAGELSGVLRMIETATQIAGQTGDPSSLDRFDIDAIMSDGARIQDARESWLRSDEAIAKIRQGRAQNAQQDKQIQALPAQAAMLKARATVQKQTGQPMPPQQAA